METLELKLRRDIFTTISTMGEMFVDGSPERECYTLEDEDRALEAGGEKIYARTAIPRGRYKIIMDWSPKYGKDMPHVLDVPGFEWIRLHPGNDADDTEGCILVGKSRHENWLRDSKIAFDALMRTLNVAWASGKEVWLEVV